MNTPPLSLHHLTSPPASPSHTDRHPAILALHGRGSNEHDLLGLAAYLPKNFFWVSPRGPFDLGPRSYEWFQITQIGKPDPARLAGALESLGAFIEEVIARYPIDPGQLFLLGFSQGSILAMSYALTHPQKVAGVIAQSGYLPLESGLQFDIDGARNTPFLLTHGIDDPILPVDWARRSRDTLSALGVALEYREFAMGHQVSEESLAVISAWLGKHIR